MEKTKKANKFLGLGTALVTPFKKQDGEVDWEKFEELVIRQTNKGADFLVPCGTTGESPTLTHREHQLLIMITVKAGKRANEDITILAGTGSNSTKEAVELTEAAKIAGADGALVISPYYNKPTPDGFRDYYRQIAKVGLPVVLYDIPGRTAKGVPTDVILELAHEGAICGIKWASGDIEQLKTIINNCPNDFSVLSGDDNRTLELMELGGDGVVSVLSNLMPAFMNGFVVDMRNGMWKEAEKTNNLIMDLMKAMFIETNPIPVKTALALRGVLPGAYFRSPMVPMESGNLEEFKNILAAHDEYLE